MRAQTPAVRAFRQVQRQLELKKTHGGSSFKERRRSQVSVRWAGRPEGPPAHRTNHDLPAGAGGGKVVAGASGLRWMGPRAAQRRWWQGQGAAQVVAGAGGSASGGRSRGSAGGGCQGGWPGETTRHPGRQGANFYRRCARWRVRCPPPRRFGRRGGRRGGRGGRRGRRRQSQVPAMPTPSSAALWRNPASNQQAVRRAPPRLSGCGNGAWAVRYSCKRSAQQ